MKRYRTIYFNLILIVAISVVLVAVFAQTPETGVDYRNIVVHPSGRCFVNFETGERVGNFRNFERVGDLLKTSRALIFPVYETDSFFWMDFNTGERITRIYEDFGEVIAIDSEYYCAVRQNLRWHYIAIEKDSAVGGEYDKILMRSEFQNRMIANVQDSSQVYWVDILGGEPIGGIRVDDEMEPHIEIAGKRFLKARLGKKWAWLDIAAKAPLIKWFDMVNKPDTFGNEIAFVAFDSTSQLVVRFRDGKQFLDDSKDIRELKKYDDKWLIYVRKMNDLMYICDDLEVGTRGDGYNYIYRADRFGDNWLLGVRDTNDVNRWVDVSPDSAFDVTYENVSARKDIGDMGFFMAQDSTGRLLWVDASNNKAVGGVFDELGDICEIDGKLYFRAMKAGKWFFVQPDKKDYTPIQYDYIGENLTPFKDMLLYSARNDSASASDNSGRPVGNFWVDINSGKELLEWGIYEYVCCFSPEHGSFRARDEGNSFWVDVRTGKRFLDKTLTIPVKSELDE